jgi:hypothetical protein
MRSLQQIIRANVNPPTLHPYWNFDTIVSPGFPQRADIVRKLQHEHTLDQASRRAHNTYLR